MRTCHVAATVIRDSAGNLLSGVNSNWRGQIGLPVRRIRIGHESPGTAARRALLGDLPGGPVLATLHPRGVLAMNGVSERTGEMTHYLFYIYLGRLQADLPQLPALGSLAFRSVGELRAAAGATWTAERITQAFFRPTRVFLLLTRQGRTECEYLVTHQADVGGWCFPNGFAAGSVAEHRSLDALFREATGYAEPTVATWVQEIPLPLMCVTTGYPVDDRVQIARIALPQTDLAVDGNSLEMALACRSLEWQWVSQRELRTAAREAVAPIAVLLSDWIATSRVFASNNSIVSDEPPPPDCKFPSGAPQ